nr:MAG TPA: hypothetical protein [Caudoviricetes sp.]
MGGSVECYEKKQEVTTPYTPCEIQQHVWLYVC